MKYTQGEWKANGTTIVSDKKCCSDDSCRGVKRVYVADAGMINQFSGSYGDRPNILYKNTPDEEKVPNVFLISASPDTYKVAKEVVDYVETNGIDKWSDEEKEGSFAWNLYKYYAKKAVAKAEGK